MRWYFPQHSSTHLLTHRHIHSKHPLNPMHATSLNYNTCLCKCCTFFNATVFPGNPHAIRSCDWVYGGSAQVIICRPASITTVKTFGWFGLRDTAILLVGIIEIKERARFWPIELQRSLKIVRPNHQKLYCTRPHLVSPLSPSVYFPVPQRLVVHTRAHTTYSPRWHV